MKPVTLALSAAALSTLAVALVVRGIMPTPWAVVAAGGLALTLLARTERRRRRDEQTLHAGAQRLSALAQNASDAILVVDAEGAIRHATGATAAVLGATPGQLEGRRLEELAHADEAAIAAPFLHRLRHSVPGVAEPLCLRLERADGTHVRTEVVGANLLHDPRVRGIVLTCRDVSARDALEAQLRHRAFHDPLTQLPNRALLLDRLQISLARPDRLVALLFVDLDDFKLVNDSLGHAAGDAVLTAVASRVRGCLRSADTAARLGGDELAVLLEEVGDAAEGETTAARILDTLRRPFVIHGEAVQVGVSVGMAVERAGTVSVEELLRRADFAMYTAKHNGKGRVERFDPHVAAELVEQFQPTAPLNEEAERVTWFARAEEQRAEVERVLADPAAHMHQVFQPLVDLRTGRVTGYEALTRFARSRRPPNAWFAQAHRCGLGIELELAAARAQIATPGRPQRTRLSLNLSPSALLSAEAAHLLDGDLSHIVVEVTEDELVLEGTMLEDCLAGLRARGARLAVDDVGAGYAGLKQVVRLRPDILKLDRSIVDGVTGDPAKGAMIDALVRYARRIGAEVCAEGIETLEDLRTLADLDVTYGQGYVLARPDAPWPLVDPAAAALCASAHLAVFRQDAAHDWVATSSELRLERVCARISEVGSPADLRSLLDPIAALLHADEVAFSLIDPTGTALEVVMVGGEDELEPPYALADYPATVSVLASGQALQVLVRDPEADPAERAILERLGYASMLMVPLQAGGSSVGVIEVYSHSEEPWSRAQIHRARILAHQLTRVLMSVRESSSVAQLVLDPQRVVEQQAPGRLEIA